MKTYPAFLNLLVTTDITIQIIHRIRFKKTRPTELLFNLSKGTKIIKVIVKNVIRLTESTLNGGYLYPVTPQIPPISINKGDIKNLVISR